MTRLEQTLAQNASIAAVNRFRDKIGWERPYTALDAKVDELPKLEVKP